MLINLEALLIKKLTKIDMRTQGFKETTITFQDFNGTAIKPILQDFNEILNISMEFQYGSQTVS